MSSVTSFQTKTTELLNRGKRSNINVGDNYLSQLYIKPSGDPENLTFNVRCNLFVKKQN